MKWIRFRVCTTTAAEDLVIDAVQELGLEGAQIENHVPLSATEKEQMFVDILPDAEEDDGTSYVSFYAEEAAPGRVLLGEGASRSDLSVSELQDKMTERLAELKAFGDFCGDLTLTVEETEDVDWINNWKTFFHQFRVDDILILPSWEEPEEGAAPPALVLHIDPGTAFGTGMHETTQLCIRAMREYLTPKTRLLDIGTGSGILAILALKLGIAEAVGYQSLSCFNRHFAEYNQCTPSEWRNLSHGERRTTTVGLAGWERPETANEIEMRNRKDRPGKRGTDL